MRRWGAATEQDALRSPQRVESQGEVRTYPLLNPPERGLSTDERMSLVPLMFRGDWRDDPSRLLDQHFGLGLSPDELVPRLRSHYLRPWQGWRLARQNSGPSAAANDQNQFQVSLDVQQFAPSELSVKVSERALVVEGSHEERADEHGYISRQFKRRYLLPEDVDTAAVSSSLSSDGVLTITAPSKKQLPPGERFVPITQTGAPALSPAPQPPSAHAPFPSPASPAGGPVTTNIRIEKEN